jgi:SsrA-binding protein
MNIVNRKAKFEYELIEKYEAGIVLLGSEVKSIRAGKISMADSYCLFSEDELFLRGVTVSAVGDKMFSHEEKRDRKLLLKRKQLEKLKTANQRGLTIVPYRVYLNSKNFIKVEIFLAKGKKTYDKRESLKKKDQEREIQRRES